MIVAVVSKISPFPSFITSNFQSEAKWRAFLVKMIFICMRIKNNCHINGFAPCLGLKQRPGATRKWSIKN